MLFSQECCSSHLTDYKYFLGGLGRASPIERGSSEVILIAENV